MSNESLKARLLALTTSNERAIVRRMADVLPEIEAAVEAGATRVQIVEALNAEGIPVTVTTFATYLSRLRNQRRRMPPSAAAAQAATPATTAAPEPAAAPAADAAAPATVTEGNEK
jgi:hypothetical protein